MDEGFEFLKQDLSSSVMLKNSDFTGTFQLQTDASNVEVGVVLSQRGGQDQPIANFSQK